MLTLQVKGMTCQHCVRSVEKAIGALDASAQVQIDLAAGRVQVDGNVAREAVVAAIVEEGYEVIAG